MEISYDAFLQKYGDVPVVFSSYYKYSFAYVGTLGNKTIKVYVGGNSSDIYKYEVKSGDEKTISELDPYSGYVYEDGKEIESTYNF